MGKQVQVKKSSGENQEFSPEKLYNSLRNAGASEVIIESVISEVMNSLYDGISTRAIYKMAFRLLKQKVHSTAARYSLKNAIMELGPTGFPFERYVGELMKKLGYKAITGQILPGKCVTHEVDVVAWNDEKKIMIECKYHNTPGRICSVQVPLYIQSRFIDVKSVWETAQENKGKKYEGWVVTNTRFSEDAAAYGICAGLRLIGWDFPSKGSLKDLVENTGLFPVTVLSGLNRRQKQSLIEREYILCTDLAANTRAIDEFGLSPKAKAKVIEELEYLSAPF
ncbi:MAG: restriction endonuclease [Lentimicrobium sp.]|nr:restriction endonuclease [Lentimicrobium sp.]